MGPNLLRPWRLCKTLLCKATVAETGTFATGNKPHPWNGFSHMQGIPRFQCQCGDLHRRGAGFSHTHKGYRNGGEVEQVFPTRRGISQGTEQHGRECAVFPAHGKYQAVGLHQRLHDRRRFSTCAKNIAMFSSRKTASRYCNPPQNGIYCDYIPTRGYRLKRAYTTPH